MARACSDSPQWVERFAPVGGAIRPTPSRRYERRRPEKTPLHKVVSENLASWLAWCDRKEQPVPGYVEEEFRGYLECGLLCFGFARAVCMTCRTGFVVAARLSRTRQDGAMDGAACSPTGPDPSRRSRRSS